MDDGYGSYVDSQPQAPGHDIGPDEDRTYYPTQGLPAEVNVHQNRYVSRSLNAPWTSVDDTLYHEINRLKTFENNWKDSFFVSPTDLSRNGFFYTGPGDKVKCVFCLKTLWNWERGDSVEGEHQKHYPHCPFVRGHCENLNVPISSMDKSLGLHMKTNEQNLLEPSNFSDRLKSYEKWPKYATIRSDALAEAGLFYLGTEDDVQCFSCGKVFSHWQPGDDPWYKHARWSPDCSYVMSVKGTDFVHQVCSPNNLVKPLLNVQEQRTRIDDDLKNPAVIALMETCPVSVEQVTKKLAEIRITQGSDYKVTAMDFQDLIQ